MKVEDWHSTKINGIQQEIYAMLWATKMARIQIAKEIKKKDTVSPENRVYVSMNFKSIMEFLACNLLQLVKTKSRKIIKDLKNLMERSQEKRERLSREAPKVVKYEQKRFPAASLVDRRA